jgi:cytochrome b pre-mRNA-processing protein 3
MFGLPGFGGRHERVAYALYGSAVRAARDPVLFHDFAVPDTLDGRFDIIGIYVFLVIRRVQRIGKPGARAAQAVFDAMFSDMDAALREMGAGDMSVGKRVRAMWEAFHGRAIAYEAALQAGDRRALADALERNVWRGAAESPDADGLAQIVLAQDRHLQAQPDPDLLAGRVSFLPVSEALCQRQNCPA